MAQYATIIGTGRYLPEIEVSNEELKERVGKVNPDLVKVVDDFQESTGIRRRWYAPRDWAASDIAPAQSSSPTFAWARIPYAAVTMSLAPAAVPT